MGKISYEQSKNLAVKLILLLAVITVVEVLIALLGKGYIIEGLHLPLWIMAVAMIGLSLFKAYKIIYEFMHLGHEAPGMLKSVLLPTALLIWAVIAFFMEGNYWNMRRNVEGDEVISKIEHSTPHGSKIDVKELNELPYQ